MNAKETAARKLVLSYVQRFALNRGLTPSLAPISTAWEPSFGRGYPVRNLNGGDPIAFFETYEQGRAACAAAVRWFSCEYPTAQL